MSLLLRCRQRQLPRMLERPICPRHRKRPVNSARLHRRPASVYSTHAKRSFVPAADSFDADDNASSVRLGAYIALWFLFSCVFNIVNKLTLNAFPMPLFISTWQLLASSMFMVVLWVTKLHPAPTLPPGVVRSLLPVAFCHSIGHVAACVSFTKMAVSFTHIVKASEPVFTVALSGPILGAVPAWLPLPQLSCELEKHSQHRNHNDGFIASTSFSRGLICAYSLQGLPTLARLCAP
jgi:hypothetical protein